MPHADFMQGGWLFPTILYNFQPFLTIVIKKNLHVVTEDNGQFLTIFQQFSIITVHMNTLPHTLAAHQTFRTIGIDPIAICIQPS
jgi:hypothetical protein